MAQFKDNAGRVWTVAITVGDLKRVREATGVKLGELKSGTFLRLAELLDDLETFANVLYLLCKPDADKLGVSDLDFGRSLAGDAISEAIDAFVRAFADFCPSQDRAVLLSLAAKAGQVQQKGAALMALKLANLDPEEILQTLNPSAGNLPGSSALTASG